MPIIRSAKKALRQSVRRRAKNLQKKEAYKRTVKNIAKLVAAGEKADAEKLLPQVYKALDKATKTNAINQNKAARIKSRMAKLVAVAKP